MARARWHNPPRRGYPRSDVQRWSQANQKHRLIEPFPTFGHSSSTWTTFYYCFFMPLKIRAARSRKFKYPRTSIPDDIFLYCFNSILVVPHTQFSRRNFGEDVAINGVRTYFDPSLFVYLWCFHSLSFLVKMPRRGTTALLLHLHRPVAEPPEHGGRCGVLQACGAAYLGLRGEVRGECGCRGRSAIRQPVLVFGLVFGGR